MMGVPVRQVVGGRGLPLGQADVSQTPEALFGEIFIVFTILGTLVGVVVIGYTLLNAYRYREGTGNGEKADVTRPSPGEIPTGSGGGKKLFLSFGISAVIVLSLIVWTYSALLYVESTPEEQEPDLTVEVVGEQFSWRFVYPNGETSINELVVPEDALVRLEVRTADVFHNFGIPAFRAKADAMPGHTTDTWFVPDERGEFPAHCYELCGAGHSGMDATVNVTTQEEYEEWYAQLEGGEGGNETATNGGEAAGDGGNETAANGGDATGNETAGGNGAASDGGSASDGGDASAGGSAGGNGTAAQSDVARTVGQAGAAPVAAGGAP